MNHDVDSENVRNGFLQHGCQLYAAECSHCFLLSFGANIIRCLWCFTLLMNLHDFVAEPVNPEHIFHDAHTVSFCLTADHIATCHMFLCPHQVSTVLVCLWTRVVWKTFGTSDVWRSLATTMESHGEMWWKRSSLHGVPWSECEKYVATSMESHGEVWWIRGNLHGVPWRGVVETWQPPWSPMERCGGNVAASMESHGQLSSGYGFWWTVTTAGIGMPWTLDQVKYLFLSVDD